ncbi:MAG: glycosyltransferase [Candidatus Latescibacteria bacterium]|nr:glycosyltransferase [Candidatus Latescibacterota bacterium]NIM20903.1 glycosyltransferase [Candidatus Latescibacterota bacterium]NIM65038.1 glycosyltransferase [Candidatus Latescibacterota bacterium]NIO01553.1 glycosyltransferase [Candidatus Latescibacterota bacterium]NIO28070.1 glycosyltransferase [Candidatus Latescibacterota bacterium]
MELKNISVIVTAYNEEKNIRRCLEALDGFGEVIVVDSFSSDRTVEIAREFPTTIYRRPYPSAARQKNWAIARAKNDWVLVVDADETLSRQLRSEIQELDSSRLPNKGFWIRRNSEYLGKKIHHCGWQRDKVLRLFRKTFGIYNEREVHEEVSLDGDAGILESTLHHFPYSDVEHHFRKINDYSSRGAKDYIERGGRHPILNAVLHPPFRFLRMYALQGGILDGVQGFVLCLLSSYGVFLKYAKAWEYQRLKRKN